MYHTIKCTFKMTTSLKICANQIFIQKITNLPSFALVQHPLFFKFSALATWIGLYTLCFDLCNFTFQPQAQMENIHLSQLMEKAWAPFILLILLISENVYNNIGHNAQRIGQIFSSPFLSISSYPLNVIVCDLLFQHSV